MSENSAKKKQICARNQSNGKYVCERSYYHLKKYEEEQKRKKSGGSWNGKRLGVSY